MLENLDTLTLITLAAVAVFVLAAIALVIMLLGGNKGSNSPGFVPLPSDRTRPGSNGNKRSTGATTAMIVCISGKQEGKKAGFRNGKVSLGRAPENDIIIEEPLISRIHAEVKYDNGSFSLEDPGSINGVWMKGQRVLQVKLKDGDQFRVGRNVFALVMPGSAPPNARNDDDDRASALRPRRNVVAQLEGYEIEGKVAEGGQAVVYKARNTNNGNIVAIKYLANMPMDADGQYFRQKFEQQIAIGTTIRHPHCVQIYAGNAKADVPYLIEEFLPNGTLDEKLRGGNRLNQNDVGVIVGQMCDALNYLHARGIIHRDIAPGNIMFDARMQAKLIDFGIARLASAPTRTAMGMLIGKAKYMSVEQARGETATEQSDLYSLGIIAYQMAVGKPPFDGADLDVIKQHIEAKPQKLRDIVPSLSEQLEYAILKALEKDPAKRFKNAREMATAFNYFKTFSAGVQAGVDKMSDDQPEVTTNTGAAKSAMPARPKLRLKHSGKVIPIASARMILQRDAINPQDKTISRQNGHIYHENEVWWINEIQNAPSQNGIYVNGDRVIAPKPLLVGDTIRIGETEIEVSE
jgi:serine/threonine protein kinase